MKRAFTLVEVLVVLFVIGVLAALTFPDFRQPTREGAAFELPVEFEADRPGVFTIRARLRRKIFTRLYRRGQIGRL